MKDSIILVVYSMEYLGLYKLFDLDIIESILVYYKVSFDLL